ncbi:MFS transporter [Mycobacteroides chelonae]|uniref:MFS transporter n=1 Tax=Mycobacteroides chelonae TaxID=1774 RepID=UPI0008A9A00F|nr:MFS transporter [Mycobacteroides chelonae]MBF9523923.1 MFS transporter [Mycobacteroides chelonae]OHU57292.1 MFS transporter [Mycobacteroides chelonae]PKQ57571.1 MFS transporter [Mycobacterium sp. MHSD3]SKL34365.1 Major facilitator superfamily [Mycobacteroides abscessus subsp. bolletii]
MSTETPATRLEADVRVVQPRAFLPVFLLAYFASAVALLAAGAVSIPLRLAELDPAHKTQVLSLTMALGGIAIILVTPPLGHLSDTSISRFGIRRPFLVGGTLVGAVGLTTLATAPTVGGVVAGWCITQIGFAATLVVFNALLADQISVAIRARVAAVFGISTSLAPVVGSVFINVLPNDPRWWFGLPAVLALMFNGAAALILRDTVRTQRVPRSWQAILASYWINPRKHQDFAWAWICRLFVTMSVLLVTVYMLYIVAGTLGLSEHEAAAKYGIIIGAFLITNTITAVISAWWSDRTGRRKGIVWTSCLITAVGLVILLLFKDFHSLLLGAAVIGAGQGAYAAVDLALMTEVLPETESSGKDLGVVAMAYLLPQLLVPMLATALFGLHHTQGDFSILYLASMVLSVLGALAVLPIKSVR